MDRDHRHRSLCRAIIIRVDLKVITRFMETCLNSFDIRQNNFIVDILACLRCNIARRKQPNQACQEITKHIENKTNNMFYTSFSVCYCLKIILQTAPKILNYKK